jgi:hypothetical protein
MYKGKCPACLLNNVCLVEHHWYADPSHTIGHIRLVCSTCNTKLQTKSGKNNHVWSDWNSQVEYIRNGTLPRELLYKISPPIKYTRYDYETTMHSIRIPIILDTRIAQLAIKNNMNKNEWITNALLRGAKINR